MFQKQRALRRPIGLHVLAFEVAVGAERTHLGHAPRVINRDVVLIAKRIHHRRRTGRAANDRATHRRELEIVCAQMSEQHLPHGRNTRREGDLLRLKQFVNRFAIKLRAGEHDFATHHRQQIRQAPCVYVKHRHDGQDAVARRNVHHVWRRSAERVQHRRAVAIQHALRIARGAARIAKARREIFIKHWPRVLVGLRGNPRFVTHQVRNPGIGRQLVRIAHRHVEPHRWTLRRNRLNEWQERHVETHHLVFRMVHDPRHLVGMQARIHRVQHAPRARNTVVKLEVPIAIPRQRSDARRTRQPHLIECIGNTLRAAIDFSVIRAVNVAFNATRNDLSVSVIRRREFDRRRNHQRVVLHQSLHGASLT